MDRLRWDNIARAGAVLAVIALVVAWPRLKGAPPALPSAVATPVTVEDPGLPPPPARAPAAPRAMPERKRRPKAMPRPTPPRRRPKPRPRRIVLRAPPAPAAPAAAPPPPASAPVRRPSADDLAAREFAVP